LGTSIEADLTYGPTGGGFWAIPVAIRGKGLTSTAFLRRMSSSTSQFPDDVDAARAPMAPPPPPPPVDTPPE
jgi:hypothetical protein